MSDSEDDLTTYGTPVEPLEEDEIPNKKPRLLEDQIVTDKQGRRRFHGAFTGGFSAGFFNTVGSLEGWTPTSFKSSKSRKQELLHQKPEDFMDEEDVSEFGIAPVVLKARQDYTVGNKKKTLFPGFPTLGTYVLKEVLKPARETVGIKLLKKMGWKQGQGVGPRLSKSEKKKSLKMRQKIYGCELPPGSLEEEDKSSSSSEAEWDDVTFAPNDYNPILCEVRTNFCGLGYKGLDRKPVLSGNSSKKKDEQIKHQSNKSGFSSQAFGVGAFEEEDEDIYEKDDMSRYNFFLGKEESGDVNKSTDKNSIMEEGVLDGFVLGAKLQPRKIYPLPKLPENFKPYHKIRRSRFDQPPPDHSKEKIIKNPQVNHENRRKLVEEPSEEILEAKKRQEAQTKNLISNVQISESKFKPFSSNPDKQERYENYLKLSKLGKKELLTDLQPLSMSNWDKEREKVEFEKAALLFKPLSGGMEDRFSTASQPDDLSDPLAVVEKYVDENDDRQKAAKANMYGPLTRRTEDWTPCALLCKRFNIPEPNKSRLPSVPKPKEKSYFNLFDSIQSLGENREKTAKTEKSSPEKEKEKEKEEKEETKKEDEPEPPETESKDQDENDIQDKTDLFKAIFLASDDEENEEETNEKEKPTEDQQSNKISGNIQEEIPYEEKIINSKRNCSPPKGIFKDIDFDSLCKRKATSSLTSGETQKSKKDEAKETDAPSLPAGLVYGPQIPEKVEAKPGAFFGGVTEDDGVWVEKTNSSGKKHKKKDKKHKKSSHKSKHKRKKHKR